MLMVVKLFLMMDRIWMILEKEHMYWSIHMEGVLLVLLIKIYMKETVHDLTTKTRQRKKSMTFTNKEEVEGSLNKKNLKIILCTLSFILIYLSFLEILKECLMREDAEKVQNIFTTLIGRHNNSILLMFQCWFIVVVFHNILSFMIQIKKSNVTTSICGKLFQWKGSRIFAQTMDSCINQISWNIYSRFNIWNANYKILAKSEKDYEEIKI